MKYTHDVVTCTNTQINVLENVTVSEGLKRNGVFVMNEVFIFFSRHMLFSERITVDHAEFIDYICRYQSKLMFIFFSRFLHRIRWSKQCSN